MSATNQNKKMTDFNYKKYSLDQLENWVHDAMSAGEASAEEIYDTIRKVVEENYYTYKNHVSRAYDLLALLNGNGKCRVEAYDAVMREKEYYEGHSDLESISCSKDDPSPECQKAWNDFWSDGYAYTPVTDKKSDVNKWVLPVEVDGASGEYYLTLPDDLLDGLGWKEGDTIEYIDNHNGTFSVKKVASKSADE